MTPKHNSYKKNTPKGGRKFPPPKPGITLIERALEKGWDFRKYTQPKAVLAWIGIQLAQFRKKGGGKVRKEWRNNVLQQGDKIRLSTYAKTFWDKWGDKQVILQLQRLERNPLILNALPKNIKIQVGYIKMRKSDKLLVTDLASSAENC